MKHPRFLLHCAARLFIALTIFTANWLSPLVSLAMAQAQAALPEKQFVSSWNWQFSDLGLVFNGGNLDVLLDDDNQPIAVYNDGDTLNYALPHGETWQVTPVLTQTLDNLNAARDVAGNLYLAGYDPIKSLPIYAHNEDMQWYTETIASAAPTGYLPNVSLNGDVPWVVCQTAPMYGQLMAAQRTSTGWQAQTVTQNANDSAPAFDVDGLPHVVYCIAAGQVCAGLAHAWYDETQWFTESVTSTLFTGYEPDFVIEPNGVMHAVFYDLLRGDLYYAVSTGQTWHIEAVDTLGDVGCAP